MAQEHMSSLPFSYEKTGSNSSPEVSLPVFPQPLLATTTHDEKLAYLDHIVRATEETDADGNPSITNPVIRWALAKYIVVSTQGAESLVKGSATHRARVEGLRRKAYELYELLYRLGPLPSLRAQTIVSGIKNLDARSALQLWEYITDLLPRGRKNVENDNLYALLRGTHLGYDLFEWYKPELNAWNSLGQSLYNAVSHEVLNPPVAVDASTPVQEPQGSVSASLPLTERRGDKKSLAQLFGALRLAGLIPWTTHPQVATALDWPGGTDNFRATYNAAFDNDQGLPASALDFVKLMLAVADETQRNQLMKLLKERGGLDAYHARIQSGRTLQTDSTSTSN